MMQLTFSSAIFISVWSTEARGLWQKIDMSDHAYFKGSDKTFIEWKFNI